MAISTIRPSADVAGKSPFWLRSQAGALYIPLAFATPSATDYVYATAGMPNTVVWYSAELNGETITLGTRRIKSIQIEADIQNPGDAGRSVKVRMSLGDAATQRNITTPDYFVSSLAGMIRRMYGAKHTNNPDGQPWTQANLNRLRVEMYSYRSANGFFIRVHTIFIRVDLKDQPTASAVTLSETNTTRPTAAGTFSATEGDLLARAQLKVFTAAQVGAAGFSPDTTSAVYDSGEQSTSSLKLRVERDLQPGTTYHAYLRGAYILNGTPFWSAWASASFTLAIEPATAPALTVTQDATLRRAILVYQGKVNLLSSDDADFESSVGNWIAGVGAAPTRSTLQARHGTASLLYTSNGTAVPFFTNSGNVGAGAIRTKAGQSYRFSFYSRAGTTGRAWRIVARQHDAANAYLGQTNGAFGTNSTTWAALPEVTHTSTVEDGYLYVQLESSATPANGEQHFFDQGQVVPGSATVAWSPGGYYPLSTARIDAWDRSTGLDNLARLELSACRDGIYKRTTADGFGTDPSNTFQGADAAAWTPSAAGSVIDFGWQHGSFAEEYALAGVGGLVAVGSIYAQASAGGNYTAAIDCYDGVGASLGVVGSETWTLTTSRQRFDLTGTLPAGTVHAKVTLTNATGSSGQTVWLSAFQWELRPAGSPTTPNPWVPGQGTAPDWQGVRGMGATTFADSRQRFALSDFEPPPGIVRTYRALIDTTLPGLEATLASTPTAPSMGAVRLPVSGDWYVKDVYFPERNTAVRVIAGSEGLDPDTSIFRPAGLEYPVAFTDFVGGQNGSYTLLPIGDQEWARLLPLLRSGSTLLLDLPEGGHRYLAVNRAGWPRRGPLGQLQREVSLEVTQVGKPPDLPAYSGLGFVSVGGGVEEPSAPVAFNRLAGAFLGGTAWQDLLDTTLCPPNKYRYVTVDWFISTADLAAIKAQHPDASILVYQNFAGMRIGPHGSVDGQPRPTSLVTFEDAQAHGPGADSWFLHAPATTISSSTNATPPVFTTATAHGLTTSDYVEVSGHSVSAYNGIRAVASVPTSTTFTCAGMTAGGAGSGGTAAKVMRFGGFPDLFAADVGSTTWRAAASQHFAAIKAAGYDGMMLDDVSATKGQWSGDVEFPTDLDYRNAVYPAVGALKTAADANGLILAANVGADPWNADHRAWFTLLLAGPKLHAWNRESYHSWSSFTSDIPWTGSAMADLQAMLAEAEAAGVATIAEANQLNPLDHWRMLRFGHAAFHLEWGGVSDSAYAYNNGQPNSIYEQYRTLLGLPLETKQLVSGTTSDGAWMRHWTYGVACVNAKSTAGLVTFNLGGTYLDPSGTPVTSVQLDMGHGMVLLTP